MNKSRYMEEQIAFALKQAEARAPVAEFIGRMGLSEQTFYRWKKVYGGLGAGELRQSTGRVATNTRASVPGPITP